MTAISLSLRQLVDARTFRLMAMVTVLTLAIFVILGVLIWHFGSPWLVARLGGWVGPTEAAAMAVLVTVLIGWFMFRGVAMGVMGLMTDSIVESVEEDHYPDVAARAVPVGFWRGVRLGLRSALRALGWNLVALPFYLVLLVTGFGTLVLMVLVNAVLLGRDLETMVAARHPGLGPNPLTNRQRRTLGLVSALAFVVPLFNFFAPVFGAALAVHMLHMPAPLRKGG